MSITLKNNTSYVCRFFVAKEELTIAQVPLEPGDSVNVPTTDSYSVVATTELEGNTYTSAPLVVTGGMGFRAQVLQSQVQGTYVFDVGMYASARPSQLVFQKTCINPVTFTIQKDGKPLQSVVVTDSFREQTLDIGDTFYIYAVINGVTTDTLSTSNAGVAVVATSLEGDHFTLVME